MPLQNFQYDTIMREYSRRQAQNHRILEKRTAEAYGKIPRLKEIDDEVATLSADKVRRLLNREEKGTADLKAAIQELSDERITLLVANGFPGDYLEMPYLSCLPGHRLYWQQKMHLFQESRDRTALCTVQSERNSRKRKF